MSDLPWQGPRCTDCGTELEPEPVATDDAIVLVYSCPTHGVVSLVNPLA